MTEQLYANIVAAASSGVRLRDIPGSPHRAKTAVRRLLAEGRLVKRTVIGKDIAIYFDSTKTASRYFEGAAGLKPLVPLREVPTSEVQVIPSFRYEVLTV